MFAGRAVEVVCEQVLGDPVCGDVHLVESQKKTKNDRRSERWEACESAHFPTGVWFFGLS